MKIGDFVSLKFEAIDHLPELTLFGYITEIEGELATIEWMEIEPEIEWFQTIPLNELRESTMIDYLAYKLEN